MKRLLAPLLGALLFVTPAAAQKVEPEEFVLDNGMKFLLLPRKEQPNAIAAGWVAKVGSVNERPGITGISHFFEHMMFKGTRTIGTRDAAKDAELAKQQHAVRGKLRHLHLTQQYQRWFAGEIEDPWDPKFDTEEMGQLRAKLKALMTEQGTVTEKNEFDSIYTKLGGTGMNAFTSYDVTFYFIQVPSNKFELWAWMESDRLNDSVFREFYSERDVVHEERRMRTESSPTGVFQEQFDAMFWQASPYSWPVIGWPSDLNSYTYDQAKAYYDIYYRPNNLVGIVVGDFDLETVKKQIKTYFSRLKKGAPPPPVITTEPKQRAEKRMYAEVDAAPQIEVRYHGVAFGHPDEAPLDVLSEVLNGRTGRLYKDLVEERKIAAGAGARQDNRKYGGAFSFSGRCKGDAKPEDLEKAWYEHVEKLKTEPVSERELQKVKNQVQADKYRSMQDNRSLMFQLGMYENLGDWRRINTGSKLLQAVTAEDIMRVAKAYFTKENRCVAIYTRKAGSVAAPVDPELDKLEGQARQIAEQSVKQLSMISDPNMLEQQITQMKAALDAGKIPPQLKDAVNYIMKKAEQRLAELKK